MLTPHSTFHKQKCTNLKKKNHEEGNLEIHHSDSSSHLDRHRHQLRCHQLHLLREATPGPSKEEGNHEEDEQSSSFFFFNFFLISLELSETTDDLLRLLFGTIILIRLLAHTYQASFTQLSGLYVYSHAETQRAQSSRREL